MICYLIKYYENIGLDYVLPFIFILLYNYEHQS
jgi:hypothetical protein